MDQINQFETTPSSSQGEGSRTRLPILEQIEALNLEWSLIGKRDTDDGPADVREAPSNHEMAKLWRSSKEECKAAGFSVRMNEDLQWIITQVLVPSEGRPTTVSEPEEKHLTNTVPQVTRESPTLPIGGVAPQQNLSDEDLKYLRHREAVVDRGLKAFVETGTALAEIRDYRGGVLYAEYGTFEKYCRARWGYCVAQAYRLINAAETMERLSPRGDKDPDELPNNEKQVRPLTRLADPEDQWDAWEKALEQSGRAEVKAALVEEIVKKKIAAGAKLKTKARKPSTHGESARDGQMTLAEASPAKTEVDRLIDAAVLTVSDHGRRGSFSTNEIVAELNHHATETEVHHWLMRNVEAGRLIVSEGDQYTCRSRAQVQAQILALEQEIAKTKALLASIPEPWAPI